ncbi:hypothetical protein [Oligoflexus tunisiensis]|uniref:hypothetical protein n=1 Tax=Oligoflexus tunisiensis TaxID=708132 RepID=UPI00114CA5C4|nr:hypothetical protein [Oligoflexus tunisiensis]
MTLHNSLLQALTVFTLGFSATAGLASPGQCTWQGASVFQNKWLECKNCKWRYCQCQPGGKWGNCTNEKPDDGACDWSNPDWTNPSCQTDGTKPCDWSNPDWSNPACKNEGDHHPPCDWTQPDWTNPNCA